MKEGVCGVCVRAITSDEIKVSQIFLPIYAFLTLPKYDE